VILGENYLVLLCGEEKRHITKGHKGQYEGAQSNEQESKLSMTFPDCSLNFGNVKILSNKNPFVLHVRHKGARKNKKRALNDMSESIKCCFKTALIRTSL